MPRYIDADKLIETNRVLLEHAQMNGMYNHARIYERFVHSIEETPTADVVPRSEYDAVVSAVDNSTKEFLKLHDEYQSANAEIERLKHILNCYALQYGTVIEQQAVIDKANQEFASEIFAAIEFDICQLDFDREETRAIAIEGIIAKAKKKYTEGKE